MVVRDERRRGAREPAERCGRGARRRALLATDPDGERSTGSVRLAVTIAHRGVGRGETERYGEPADKAGSTEDYSETRNHDARNVARSRAGAPADSGALRATVRAMRGSVLLVGCGAIGGVIGARLSRARVAVRAVTGNPDVTAALATNGFRVRDLDGVTDVTRPTLAPVTHASELPDVERGGYDTLIVCTKSTTLAHALASALPYIAPDAPVVVCQNGLPEELAATLVAPARIVGCVVVWGASMTGPGDYTRTADGRFQLGRHVADGTDPAPVAALLSAVAPGEVVDNLAAIRWSKLAVNCATSTLGAIAGERLGTVLVRRFGRRLALEVFTEVAAVAHASGVHPAKLAGSIDLARLSLAPRDRTVGLGSPALALKHSLLFAIGLKYRRMRSSMLIALERGRAPEIDHLNGLVCARGRTHGVPTPANDLAVATIRQLESGALRPSMALLRSLAEQLAALPTTTPPPPPSPPTHAS